MLCRKYLGIHKHIIRIGRVLHVYEQKAAPVQVISALDVHMIPASEIDTLRVAASPWCRKYVWPLNINLFLHKCIYCTHSYCTFSSR